MNCEPDRCVGGDRRGKKKRGRGRKRRKEVLQYKGMKIVWLANTNAFRRKLSSLIHIDTLQSAGNICFLTQNII